MHVVIYDSLLTQYDNKLLSAASFKQRGHVILFYCQKSWIA